MFCAWIADNCRKISVAISQEQATLKATMQEFLYLYNNDLSDGKDVETIPKYLWAIDDNLGEKEDWSLQKSRGLSLKGKIGIDLYRLTSVIANSVTETLTDTSEIWKKVFT